MNGTKPTEFDGMTVRSQLLTDIKALLILQLITSGISGAEIAHVLGYANKKDFLRDFPWVNRRNR